MFVAYKCVWFDSRAANISGVSGFWVYLMYEALVFAYITAFLAQQFVISRRTIELKIFLCEFQ